MLKLPESVRNVLFSDEYSDAEKVRLMKKLAEKLGIEYRLKGVPPMDKTKLIEKKEVILNGIRKRRAEMKELQPKD